MDRSLPSTAKPARPPTARSMLRTATHEAAHAVVALDERMTFEAVVLERTERSSGMLVNLRVRAIEDDDHVRVSLAGIIAHRLAVGRWHRQQFSRAHDDLASVAEFYRRHGDTASLRYNIDRVHEVLRARWGAVERIATELLRANRLVFTAVEEIAIAAPPSVTVPKAVRPGDWPRLVGAVEHHLSPLRW